MRSTIQFVLIVSFSALSLGAVSPDYNVTSGPEDYTLLVGRHMQNELDLGELQVASVKARHSDRMESIIDQQQLVLQEVQQFDNSMVQRQAFSLSNKHCVQKYKSSSPTFNQVNADFTKCLTDANAYLDTLTTSAEMNLQKARTVRDTEIPRIFPYCNSSYTDETKVENCVTSQVEKQVELFNKYMDLIEINLQYSLYSSSVIAAEATRCSFVVEKKVLETNGAVVGLADVCVDELKSTPLALAYDSGNVIKEGKFMQSLRAKRLLK